LVASSKLSYNSRCMSVLNGVAGIVSRFVYLGTRPYLICRKGAARSSLALIDSKASSAERIPDVLRRILHPRPDRSLCSSAPNQAIERDYRCTGYVCDRREVGECVCSNDRAKRDREKRKLSPEEIKVCCCFRLNDILNLTYFSNKQKRCAGCAVFPCSEHEYPDVDCEEQRACEDWFDDNEK
jgi:hypothetical protein